MARRRTDEPTTPLDAELLGRISAELAHPPLPADVKARLRVRILGAVEAEARGVSVVRADEGAWQPDQFGDIRVLHRDEAAGTWTYLLRIPPGVHSAKPPHFHGSAEECFMLEGEMSLGGLSFQAGDYVRFAAGTPHGPLRCERGALVLVRSSLDYTFAG